MHDLESMIPEDSGWVLQIARAINNDGQITGTGIHNGATRAFLLTPVRNRGLKEIR
jgi:probable HAF family extracellular repeat protein